VRAHVQAKTEATMAALEARSQRALADTLSTLTERSRGERVSSLKQTEVMSANILALEEKFNGTLQASIGQQHLIDQVRSPSPDAGSESRGT